MLCSMVMFDRQQISENLLHDTIKGISIFFFATIDTLDGFSLIMKEIGRKKFIIYRLI
jgi:hypothetical protein